MNHLFKYGFLTFSFWILLTPLFAQANLSTDEEKIKELIDMVYAGFKVRDGVLPDFDQIKTYFSPDAKMGSVRNGNPRIVSYEEYLGRMKERFSTQAPSLLEEWEISGQTQIFGNIAQRISAYGVYVNSRDSLGEKGVNAFQLIKIQGEWKIISMVWDVENEFQIVPDFGKK